MQLDSLKGVTFRKLKKALAKYDVVTMNTSFKNGGKYLVLNVDTNHLKVLPLDIFYNDFESGDTICSVPISIPFNMVNSISKNDKVELLFLAATRNPHILAALS